MRLGTDLARHAALGFEEALDLQFGFQGHAVLVASVFPLSFVALALQAIAPLDPAWGELARAEAEAIAALGDESGWRYFNLVADIPPDADLLAQAIAVLHAFDLPGWRARLRGPLALLERNRVGPGQYRTWLVPDAREATAVDAAWASAAAPVHPEVVANVLAALLRADPPTWRAEARAAAAFLTPQLAQGLASFWYYGHAYGTYQAVRLLAELGRQAPELGAELAPGLTAARSHLLATQAACGGWLVQRGPVGLEVPWEPATEASPLETALALLALAELAADGEIEAAIARGSSWLTAQVPATGGLAPEPFYFTMGLAPYASGCLVTALATLALVSAQRARV